VPDLFIQLLQENNLKLNIIKELYAKNKDDENGESGESDENSKNDESKTSNTNTNISEIVNTN
jgi:hypothetical protein